MKQYITLFAFCLHLHANYLDNYQTDIKKAAGISFIGGVIAGFFLVDSIRSGILTEAALVSSVYAYSLTKSQPENVAYFAGILPERRFNTYKYVGLCFASFNIGLALALGVQQFFKSDV